MSRNSSGLTPKKIADIADNVIYRSRNSSGLTPKLSVIVNGLGST